MQGLYSLKKNTTCFFDSKFLFVDFCLHWLCWMYTNKNDVVKPQLLFTVCFFLHLSFKRSRCLRPPDRLSGAVKRKLLDVHCTSLRKSKFAAASGPMTRMSSISSGAEYDAWDQQWGGGFSVVKIEGTAVGDEILWTLETAKYPKMVWAVNTYQMTPQNVIFDSCEQLTISSCFV